MSFVKNEGFHLRKPQGNGQAQSLARMYRSLRARLNLSKEYLSIVRGI